MNSNKTILIIDDEINLIEMLDVALKKWGYRTKLAHNLKEGLAALDRGKVDCVVSDLKLPDGVGTEVLQKIKILPEKPPVILMTAFGNTDSAVDAMRLGAYHYILKPFKLDELKVLLERALENKSLKDEVKKDFSTKSILGHSKSIKNLLEMIDRVSKTKTNILITGESGTGKELVARAIHYTGVLKNKPFVAVNCGAIPETLIESELFGHRRGSFTGAVVDKDGLFRVADGGTIFLDEIGELPLLMQVKLLRVLQDKSFRAVGGTENIKVDLRVISATNRNLETQVAKNLFREDLYYRLNVINIKTPPLRDRKEDIPELVDTFLRKFSLGMGKQLKGLEPKALDALMKYPFPGNVRELENMMERAIALEGSDQVMLESLPPAIQELGLASTTLTAEHVNQTSSDNSAQRKYSWESAVKELDKGAVDLEHMVGELEKEFITAALLKTGGAKKKAAELLGITFRSMRYRIAKYGIHDEEGELADE